MIIFGDAHAVNPQNVKTRVLKMLEAECEKLGFSLSDKLKNGSIMLDFEKAIINSVSTKFPNCKINACRFHLAQS